MRHHKWQIWHRTAQQVHHIETSYRWARKHSRDGSDLLGVCAKCHSYIHNVLWNNEDVKYDCRLLAAYFISQTELAVNTYQDPKEMMREQLENSQIYSCIMQLNI